MTIVVETTLPPVEESKSEGIHELRKQEEITKEWTVVNRKKTESGKRECTLVMRIANPLPSYP